MSSENVDHAVDEQAVTAAAAVVEDEAADVTTTEVGDAGAEAAPADANAPAEPPQVGEEAPAATTDAVAETEEAGDAAAAPPAQDAAGLEVPEPVQVPVQEQDETAAAASSAEPGTGTSKAPESAAAAPEAAAEAEDVAVESANTTAPQSPMQSVGAEAQTAPLPAASTVDDGVETASLHGAASERSAAADADGAASPPTSPPQPSTPAAASPGTAAPAAAAEPALAPAPAPAPAPAKRQSQTPPKRQSSAPIHTQPPQRPQPQPQQQPQPAAPAQRPVLSSFGGVATSSAIASSVVAPYMSETAPSAAYELLEAERVAMAAASLTPNTVLAVFRRGHENSHVNRMDLGSYSRYLLSTDHMPAVVLDSTFHGEAATVGPVPRNTLNASGRGKSGDSARQGSASRTSSRGRTPSPQHSGRAATASSTSPRRAEAFPQAAPPDTADGRPTSSGIFSGTVASSTVNVRRELTMVQGATLTDLNSVRQIRRRDPRHGKTTEEQHDYYYYNHRSKGYYVPHDPPADTVMMQYNHMYSFGDGTRFSSRPPGSRVLDIVPNPHAAAPRTFAETRGSAFPFTASQRLGNSAPASASVRSRIGKGVAATAAGAGATASSWSSAQSQRGGVRSAGAGATKGSSSLRTAKALDLGRLHCTQCPRPRSIEEVMADQPQQYLCGADGVRGPLVHDIERDVEVGKLQWTDVPGSMRHAMATATSSAAAASTRYSQPPAASGLPSSVVFSGTGRTTSPPPQQQRAGSLATAPNALENVMGQVRAVSAIAAASAGPHGNGGATKAMSTAPPSPAAAAVRAAAAGDRDSAAGEAVAARRGPHAAALPAISRLSYTPQPTRRSNPSAFV